jgi:hypothetical protein
MTILSTGEITLTNYNNAPLIVGNINTAASLKVLYDNDGSFYPNWATAPITLTAILSLAGKGQDLLISANDISNYKWYVSIDGIRSELISGEDGVTISGTYNKTCTINNNLFIGGAKYVSFEYEAYYTDPLTNVEIPGVASLDFERITNDPQTTNLLAYGLDGILFTGSVTPAPTSLTLKADLRKGVSPVTPQSYQWYILDSSINRSTVKTTVLSGVSTIEVTDISKFRANDNIVFNGNDATEYTINTLDFEFGTITFSPVLSEGKTAGTYLYQVGFDASLGEGWKKLENTQAVYTGVTTDTLEVYPTAINSFATFRVKTYDISLGINTCDIDIKHIGDNLYVSLHSTSGNIIEDGDDKTIIIAKVFNTSGEEVDKFDGVISKTAPASIINSWWLDTNPLSGDFNRTKKYVNGQWQAMSYDGYSGDYIYEWHLFDINGNDIPWKSPETTGNDHDNYPNVKGGKSIIVSSEDISLRSSICVNIVEV